MNYAKQAVVTQNHSPDKRFKQELREEIVASPSFDEKDKVQIRLKSKKKKTLGS